MENNKETLTDIDKAKELFEYEMTEILLNLHGKFDNVGKDITSEYLNMEIEEPKLEYDAPEITLTGISYEQQSSGKLEKVDLKADAVKIELPELPSAEPVAVKAIDKADVDMQAVKAALSGTAADASKFSAKGLIAGIEKASQPRVISVDVNVSEAEAPILSELPKAAPVPEINIEMPEVAVDSGRFTVAAPDKPEIKISSFPMLSEASAFKCIFELIAPEREKISIGYEPTGTDGFAVPELHRSSVTLPRYTQPAPKPDVSSIFYDLMEAVKSEI